VACLANCIKMRLERKEKSILADVSHTAQKKRNMGVKSDDLPTQVMAETYAQKYSKMQPLFYSDTSNSRKIRTVVFMGRGISAVRTWYENLCILVL
jgi:hypothetical protein